LPCLFGIAQEWIVLISLAITNTQNNQVSTKFENISPSAFALLGFKNFSHICDHLKKKFVAMLG
jgi:hypothetical protein